MTAAFSYFGFATIKDGKVATFVRENMITDDPLFDNANLCQEKGAMIQAIVDNMSDGVPDGDHRFSSRGRFELKDNDGTMEAHVIFEFSSWAHVDPPNLFEILQRDCRPTWIDIVYPKEA